MNPELAALHAPIVEGVLADVHARLDPPAGAAAAPAPPPDLHAFVERMVHAALESASRHLGGRVPPAVLESLEAGIAAVVADAAESYLRVLMGARALAAQAAPPVSGD